MKKLITLLLCGAMLAINCAALSADNSSYEYTIDDKNITVEFNSDSSFSPEQQQQIADYMVYGDDGISTYSLCWLLGHKYGPTEDVGIIIHKVYDKSPRCQKSIYSVKRCTNCDHMEESLLSQTVIACCPED